MSDQLAIIGAGGHGREAFMVARARNHADQLWGSVDFVDDGPVDLDRLRRLDASLLGTTDLVVSGRLQHVIAIGDPATRATIAAHIGVSAPAIALVDPRACLGDDVELEEGAMVFPGAICTTNVRLGSHAHVNCGAIVSHDCRVGDFVSLSPGVRLNGAVSVGRGAFLGTGAIVLPGVSIGQDAVVGAGAVVTTDVADGATVVGVPAR